MVEGISAICASGWRRILCIYGVFSDRFFGNICGAISVIHFSVFAFKIPSQHLAIYRRASCQPLAALQDSSTSTCSLTGPPASLRSAMSFSLLRLSNLWESEYLAPFHKEAMAQYKMNYFIAFIPQQIFSLSPSVHHNPGHLSLHMWAAKKVLKTRPCSMKTSLLETPPWFSCVGSVQFTQSDWEGGSLLILGILIVVMWLVTMILINIIMISMIKWSWSR